MYLRWRKAVFGMFLIWDSKHRVESKVISKFFRSSVAADSSFIVKEAHKFTAQFSRGNQCELFSRLK